MRNCLSVFFVLLSFSLLPGVHAGPVQDLIYEAEEYYDQNDFSTALDLYNQIIDLDHLNSLAWQRKGDVLMMLGRNDEATQVFNEHRDIISKTEPFVLVKSIPSGATVRIDQSFAHQTPHLYEGVSLGTHTITISPPGYLPVTKTVSVPESGLTFYYDEFTPVPDSVESSSVEPAQTEDNQAEASDISNTNVVSESSPDIVETNTTGIFTFTLSDDGKSMRGTRGYGTEDSPEEDPITLYSLAEEKMAGNSESPWTGTWSNENEVITLVQEGKEVSGTSILDNITQSFLEGNVSENGLVLAGTWSMEPPVDKRPDLIISTISMKELSNVIAVMMTLENTGYGDAGAFTIRYFLTDTYYPDKVDGTIYYLDKDTVSFLEARKDRTASEVKMYNLPSDVPKGTYYVGAIVDSENLIEESNEQNNVLYDEDRIQVEKDLN